MNKFIYMLVFLSVSSVLSAAVSASKCGPNKIEVFYPAHTENDKKILAETKCETKKDWKIKSKGIKQKIKDKLEKAP